MSGIIFVWLVGSAVASEASKGHLLPPGKSDPFRVLRVLKYSGSDRVNETQIEATHTYLGKWLSVLYVSTLHWTSNVVQQCAPLVQLLT